MCAPTYGIRSASIFLNYHIHVSRLVRGLLQVPAVQTTRANQSRRLLKKVWVRGVLILFCFLLVLLGVAYAAVTSWAPPRIVRYLQAEVATRTDSLYHLEVGSLSLNPLRGNVELRDITLRADTAQFRRVQLRLRDQGQFYDITVPRLSLRRINLYQAWSDRQLMLSGLDVVRPRVRVILRPLRSAADTTQADTTQARVPPDSLTYESPLELYQYISNVLDVIQIGRLRLIDGDVSLETWNDTSARLDVPHVDITFDSIRIDSVTRYDEERFFYARRFRAEVRDYYFETPDSFYAVSAQRLLVHSDPGTLALDCLHVRPRYGRLDHGRKAGEEKDRYVTELPELRIEQFDLKRLLRLREVRAGVVTLTNLKVNIFRDKRERFPHQYKPLPPEALRRLPVWVDLDTVRLQNMSIAYEEVGPQSQKAGVVLFNQIDAEISRVTNDPIALAAGAIMHVEADGRLMGKGRASVQLDFHLGDSEGYFTSRGRLGAFDLRELNVMAEERVFMHIEGGQMHEMTYELEGNNRGATGRMHLPYEGLRVSLIDKQTGDTTKFLEEAASFLVNALVLKDSNPSRERRPPREGHIYYERDPEKSFLNYWWKALFSGMKDVAGVADPRPQKRTFWEWFGVGKKEEKDH